MQWKPCDSLARRYEVSEYGDVRSNTGRLRKPQLSYKGYLVLKISPDKGKAEVTRSVHSLVAEAFLAPRPGGAHINHKDGVKLNNHYSNLEWVSPAENNMHALRTGLYTPYKGPKAMPPQAGTSNFNSKLTEEQAKQIIERIASGEAATSICKDYQISASGVRAIRDGRRWQHLTRYSRFP